MLSEPYGKEKEKVSKCFECNKPAQVEHHVVPKVLGGTKTIPLCNDCHSKVHGKNLTNLTRLKEKKLKENARKGQPAVAALPVGYKRIGKRGSKETVIDEEKKWIPQKAFELYEKGYSLFKITEYFKTCSYFTKQGKDLSRQSAYNLLKNRLYLGEITYGGISSFNESLQIIDSKTFMNVQHLLLQNNSLIKKSKNAI